MTHAVVDMNIAPQVTMKNLTIIMQRLKDSLTEKDKARLTEETLSFLNKFGVYKTLTDPNEQYSHYSNQVYNILVESKSQDKSRFMIISNCYLALAIAATTAGIALCIAAGILAIALIGYTSFVGTGLLLLAATAVVSVAVLFAVGGCQQLGLDINSYKSDIDEKIDKGFNSYTNLMVFFGKKNAEHRGTEEPVSYHDSKMTVA